MSETENTHDQNHAVNYLAIFGMLCVLTVVSVATDFLPIGNLTVIIAILALAVATVKASLVLMYFMHLKFEKHWKFLLLIPTVLLAIGLPLALVSDISIHYYTVESAEQGTPGTSLVVPVIESEEEDATDENVDENEDENADEDDADSDDGSTDADSSENTE